MALPPLGTCVGIFILFLLLYTGYAFRINKDGGLVSSEQTKPACGGTFFGKCSDRTPVSAAFLGDRPRRKYESVSATLRSVKNQPPVDAEVSSVENGEDEDEGETLGSRTKRPRVEVSRANIWEQVKLHARNGYDRGSTNKAGIRTKVTQIESEADDEVKEEENGSEDEAVVVDEVEGSDEEQDDSDGDDDVADDDNDDDDDDENDDCDDVGDDDNDGSDDNDDDDDDDDDGGDDDDDEDDEVEPNDSEADSKDRDNEVLDEQSNEDEFKKNSRKGRGEKNKETDDTEDYDDDEDEDGDDNDDSDKDEVSWKNIVRKKISNAETHKRNIPNDLKSVPMISSSRKIAKENVAEIVASMQQKDEPITTISRTEKDFKISKEIGKDNGSDKEKAKTSSEISSTLPPCKLEKVRLADKTKSMEIFFSKSVEVDAKQIDTKRSSELVDDSKREGVTKSFIESFDIKPPTKPEEKPKIQEKLKLQENLKPEDKLKSQDKSKPQETPISLTPRKETQKTKIESPKKDAVKPQTKQKEQPNQSEKSKSGSKESEPRSLVKKDTKPKSKPKRTEASITLTELNDLILYVPTFVPNFTAIEDPACQQQGKIFLRQLRGYKLWALQMLDASAKIPSGMLRGNVNQLGDFDQCLGITSRVKVDEMTVKVQGKYCLATIDLHATRQDMKVPVNLIQSRGFIRGNMRDSTHFIPRFTTVNWALCLPAACSAEDARAVIENALSPYNVSAGLRFTVGIDPEMCQTRQKFQSFSKETIGVLYFYAVVVCLVLVSTLRDFCVTSEGKGTYPERIIMSFSLRRTMKVLLQDESSSNDIKCIHGIRSLATIALYVAHKLIPVSRIPFANRISLTEVANNPLSTVLRVSLVYTDSFLLLSGVLTAYNMTKDLMIRGEIRWFCRFIARFVRLTPALLALVFWYAFVMEHVGSGPQWNSVVMNNANLCKQNAWTNLLYIQNFFPFEEMCATHTHQLALDMQLSLIAPVLVFFLYCKPIIGILLVFFLLQVSATVRYLVTMNNSLSLVIFHGMTSKHLYKTANLTYAQPLHRATPYIFGVGLGVLLRYTGKNVRIHKAFVILGWLIATTLGGWSLFSPWRTARRDYIYDVEEATHFAVICPVSWALMLCWVIFASYTEHGGIINRILSCHLLIVFSKISYAVYLTQFAVFFYNIGTTRYSTEFQAHRIIDIFESATVIVVSIVLTLSFDIPMQELKNIIMESTDGLTIDVPGENEADKETGEQEQQQKKEGETSKIFDDDEVESTGWDWQKDIIDGNPREGEKLLNENEEFLEVIKLNREQQVRRRSFMRQDHEVEGKEDIPTWDWIKAPSRVPYVDDEDDGLERGRRSRSSQRSLLQQQQQQLKEEQFRRERRAQSHSHESRKPIVARESEDPSWEILKRERSTSGAGEGNRAPIKEPEKLPSKQFDQRERSESKGRTFTKDQEESRSWEFVRRERSASRGKDSKWPPAMRSDEEFETPSRLTRASISSGQSNANRILQTSETGEELLLERKTKFKGSQQIVQHQQKSVEEPRVNDEKNWEQELRLRRQKLASRGSEEEEEDWTPLKRRSSAEGKIALLKGPPEEIDTVNRWATSKLSRETGMSSSQDPSEPEEEESNISYSSRRKAYRESAPPLRDREETQSEEDSSWDPSRGRSYTSGSQPTSVDEEEDEYEELSGYDIVLNKHRSRQNLSKLSQEEADMEEDSSWNLVEENRQDHGSRSSSTGLFKRESIIKSQASEEDPEYLLPERPKLVEQEQEHPFKKAWQMQKSRSEEEGPTGFLQGRDNKQSYLGGGGGNGSGNKRESSSPSLRGDSFEERDKDMRGPAGGQSEDLGYLGGDETESTSIWQSDKVGNEERDRQSPKSDNEEELHSQFISPGEYERHVNNKRVLRRSEEMNWNCEQEET